MKPAVLTRESSELSLQREGKKKGKKEKEPARLKLVSSDRDPGLSRS